MSLIEKIKLWFRALQTAIKAVDEGPYGYLNSQIALLNARVSILENEGSTDLGTCYMGCAAKDRLSDLISMGCDRRTPVDLRP